LPSASVTTPSDIASAQSESTPGEHGHAEGQLHCPAAARVEAVLDML
jgi:hypothetical protein